jgi:hypothetical protein
MQLGFLFLGRIHADWDGLGLGGILLVIDSSCADKSFRALLVLLKVCTYYLLSQYIPACNLGLLVYLLLKL